MPYRRGVGLGPGEHRRELSVDRRWLIQLCRSVRPDIISRSQPPVKIHEYQAKSVLARFGVPVPRGEVAFSPAEAGEIARRLGGDVVVVKAQIHAGGRGKGGGVKLAKSPDEAEQLAKQISA